ncbi:MAG: BON domain-containing protein [Gammaproteobacteria bacterium]|nr:BON domain-containing protein [Gammaproteobacteria bacterium]
MMKQVLLCNLLLITLFLSGCLPAVFVAGATAGGSVITDRRSFQTILKDKQITCKSLIQLNSEPALKNCSHISVATFNRVVLLVGETENMQLRDRAYELVKAVPNIRRITNEIVIGDPLDGKGHSTDMWITTKVKTAMLAEKGLNSTQIKVITEGTVVYLMGLVTHCQAETAINVVRQVTGVTKVVTLFEFCPG